MPATISKSMQASQRRERFREYMRKLNPTAPARLAIDSGLVVEDLHGSQFKGLVARADLEPASQQLVVGGTGSGKTTALLLAEKWLEQQGQTLCSPCILTFLLKPISRASTRGIASEFRPTSGESVFH
jgi:hypothetical protein